MSQLLAELDIFCDGPHRADPAFQPRHKQDLHNGSAPERESSLKSTEHSEITLPVIVSARESSLAGFIKDSRLPDDPFPAPRMRECLMTPRHSMLFQRQAVA
jgi:hypothetical protein